MSSLTLQMTQKFLDAAGKPLIGGKLYLYQAGTSIPFQTFSDQSALAANPNPIVLDSNGEAKIWMGSGAYKAVLTDSSGVTQWSVDLVSRINAGSVTTSHIPDGGVTSAKIADGSVSTLILSDSSVTTSKISDNTISLSKVTNTIEMNLVNEKIMPRFTWSATPSTVVTTEQLPSIAYSVEWTPDGKFLTVGHFGTTHITTYERMGDSFIKTVAPDTLPTSSTVLSLSYSPTGEFLAAAPSGGLFLYQRQGTSLVKLTDPATLPAQADTVKWSKDGRFLVATDLSSPFLHMYERAGSTVTYKTGAISAAAATTGADWSPDGNYLAVAGATTLYLYQRSGSTFVPLSSPTVHHAFATTSELCAFSPDGRFLAVTGHGGSNLYIYSVSGSVFTLLSNPSTLPTGFGRGVSWTPDSQFLAVTSSTAPCVLVYQVSGTTFTKLADPSTLPAGGTGTLNFSPDGQFLATAASLPGIGFRVGIYKTDQTLLSNGIIYGSPNV